MRLFILLTKVIISPITCHPIGCGTPNCKRYIFRVH